MGSSRCCIPYPFGMTRAVQPGHPFGNPLERRKIIWNNNEFRFVRMGKLLYEKNRLFA